MIAAGSIKYPPGNNGAGQSARHAYQRHDSHDRAEVPRPKIVSQQGEPQWYRCPEARSISQQVRDNQPQPVTGYEGKNKDADGLKCNTYGNEITLVGEITQKTLPSDPYFAFPLVPVSTSE